MERQSSVQQRFKDKDGSGFKDTKSKTSKSVLASMSEITLLLLSCTVIIGLSILPIAFHYTDSTKSTNLTLLQEKLFALQQNASSTNRTVVVNSTASCSSDLLAESWVMDGTTNDSCSSHVYGGSICKPYLQIWSSCVLDSNESADIAIVTSEPLQIQQESLLAELNGFLNGFPECQSEAVPFFCQYFFPLVDCDNRMLYQSSKEECLRISTTVCSTLWNFATLSGYGDSLPVCDDLHEANSFPSMASNQSTFNETYNTTQLECEEDFTVINATCHPKCNGFIQNSQAANIFLLSSELLAAIVVILLSIPIAIFSIKNRVGVYSYPSFLIIFIAGNMLLQAILVVVSAVDRDELFCSSPDVITSLDNPTTFTIISGGIYHYLLMNLVAWWFVHILLFLTRICLPNASVGIINQGLHKVISVTVILLCLLLPLAALLVAFSTERHIYRLQRLPPGLPTTSKELWFYSVILFYCIFLAGGLCMLTVSAWILLKQTLKKKMPVKNAKADWSLVLCFTLTGVYFILYVIYSSVWTVNYNNFTRTLTEYFLCQALGSTSCSRDEFEKYSYPILEGFSSLCRIFVQVGILVFTINGRVLDVRSHNWCFKSSQAEEKTVKMEIVNPAYI